MGFESSDDAAVYRLTPDLALVSTADFITPPVDDPAWFGRIAAANALSDVYAMGGRPLTALNLLMFPTRQLGADSLREVLRGGHEKVVEAGAVLAGGHSVEDEEPKYGLAVTGVVHPERLLTNSGARPGDALVLTKPLGTGVLFNARRSGRLPLADLEPLLPVIAALNRAALEAALPLGVHGCTDITGFGLAGHALEMARASGVTLELRFADLPLHPHAEAMYRKGETTGSNPGNRTLVQDRLEVTAPLSPAQRELLFDPQTSGGLLLALPEDQVDPLLRGLKRAGVAGARCVGQAREGEPGLRIR